MSHILEDTSTEHFTCKLWCSCQFPAHWGLPCRHMLAVWHREGHSTIPDGVVHARWLLADEDEELRRLYSYRARALPRLAPRAADAIMSAGERNAELGALGKLIAEVASTTPALHAAARIRLQDMLVALQNCALTAGDNRGARTQAAARAHGLSEGMGAATSNPAPLPAARNPSKKTKEKGGPRTKGLQERLQDAARAKAERARAAAAAQKAPKRTKTKLSILGFRR